MKYETVLPYFYYRIPLICELVTEDDFVLLNVNENELGQLKAILRHIVARYSCIMLVRTNIGSSKT